MDHRLAAFVNIGNQVGGGEGVGRHVEPHFLTFQLGTQKYVNRSSYVYVLEFRARCQDKETLASYFPLGNPIEFS
jgi:hypothetical protein